MNTQLAPFLSESLTRQDYAKGWRVAVIYRGKIYTGKIGNIHIQVIERYRLPHDNYKEVITGYIDNRGKFKYQFESNLPKKGV